MSLTGIYLVITYVIGIISSQVSNYIDFEIDDYGNEIKCIRRNDSRSKLAIWILTIIAIIFMAFRKISATAIDEMIYRNRFIKFSSLSFKDAFFSSTEYLFNIIVWVSTRLFSSSQGLLIITGTLTVLLYFRTIKKHAQDYSFGILLFFLMGVFYNTFNGIQQCLAAGVFFAFYDCIPQKNVKRFLVVAIICCAIHNASIFLLLFYFIGNMKFKSIKSIVLSGLLAMGAVAVYRVLPSIISATGMLTEYYDILVTGHYGVGRIRILINLIPTMLAFLIPQEAYEGDSNLNTIANFSLLNAVLYIVSILDTYIARFALFTIPFNVLLLTNILDYFNLGSKRILKFVSIILFTVFTVIETTGDFYAFNFVF